MDEDLLDPDFVTEKLIEFEDRSQRNNLRIDGVEETPNEIWDVCEEKFQSIIKEELEITVEIEFDLCHRTGKFQKNQSKSRTIVCRFLRFKDKEKILKNSKKLKDTGIFILKTFVEREWNYENRSGRRSWSIADRARLPTWITGKLFVRDRG